MTAVMSVLLTQERADPQWGEEALLSFSPQGAHIHLVDPAARQRTIQKAARRLSAQGVGQVALQGDGWQLADRWVFYNGFCTPKGEPAIDFGEQTEADRHELEALIAASQLVRRLTNGTPEEISPLVLATRAAEYLKALAPEQVSYRIVSGEALAQEGWMGIYHVARGSACPGAMLQLDYNPGGDTDAPVAAALVGKGITFDSGGYSLKPSDGMSVMKSDMGGAAMVTAGLGLAILRGLKQRVKLYLCCAENLVSGQAYKLGDILTYKNGLTVEILNTDAEGRLVLADGLLAASEDKPALLIDAATLTGAAKMALGRDYNALLAFDQTLLHQALTYAAEEQEQAWPLPLETWHQGLLSSAFADMANVSGAEGSAGASTAAAFLSRFVTNPQQGWLHMDLSGSYQKVASELWAAGAKGHGFRTIARTLLEYRP